MWSFCTRSERATQLALLHPHPPTLLSLSVATALFFHRTLEFLSFSAGHAMRQCRECREVGRGHTGVSEIFV